MNDLIERIDAVDYGAISGKLEILLTDCRAEIERLEALREYVPMTDDEKSDFARSMVKETRSVNWLAGKIEAAVINRAGLRIKERNNG